MSTHRFLPAKCKGRRLPFLFMLGGLLLLFPLLLPATALAAPRNATATPPLTKSQQIVDLAGVSVVRLALSYLPAKGNGSIVCTSLGTIVASWPTQNGAEQNNWVLTDGSLLNTSKNNKCAPGGTLDTISLFASNEFTDNQSNLASLATLTCTTAGSCTDIAGKEMILTLPASSAILFSFHTSAPLPFVDVERASTNNNPAPTSIELVSSATGNSIPASPTRNVNVATLTQFLTPFASSAAAGSAPATVGTASAQTSEPGMPYVDGNGKITGMQLLNTAPLVTFTDIENLENQIPVLQGKTLAQNLESNTLSQQWDNGIIQYEQGNYQAAIQTLHSIQNAPSTFKAPTTFIDKAEAKLPQVGTPVPNSSSRAGSNQSGFLWLIVIGLIAGILALILLFLFVAIRFGRKRLERKRNLELEQFEADVNKARQRVEGKEKSLAVPEQYLPSSPFYSGAANYHPASTQNVDTATNVSHAPRQSTITTPSPRNNVQPQQPAPAPKMQDDPAIRAALQRLWDRAGR